MPREKLLPVGLWKAQLMDAMRELPPPPGSKGSGYLGIRNRMRMRPEEVFTRMMGALHEIDGRHRGTVSNRSAFYNSPAWKTLRYQVLEEANGRCQCCGASAQDGAKLQVDHIKPISRYPDLALVKSNLQVLCRDCNVGKSNRSERDWRQKMSDEELARKGACRPNRTIKG